MQKNHHETIKQCLSSLVRKSHLNYWVRCKDYRRFLYSNHAFQAIFPQLGTQSKPQGLDWLEQLHPEDAERLTEELKNYCEHVNPETQFEIEYRMDIGGEYRTIHEHAHAIFLQDKHVAYAGHCYLPGVNKENQTYKANPEDNSPNSLVIGDVLCKLAQKSRDVFWVRSADYTKQVFVSPSFEEIWGRSSRVLFDEPERWTEFLHPEDRERLGKSIAQRTPHIEEDTTFLMEYRCIRPNGEIRWIRDESFPIYDDFQQHIGFAGIAQDITNEKELESAKEQAKVASQSKSEFLANMSHDLRTPLNWLLGAAELLKKRNQNPEQDKLFDMILDGGVRIQHMVEEILDYAKLESGKLPFYRNKLNLRQVLEEVVTMLSNEATQKKIDIILDYPDNIPRLVIGDTQRLRRVFLNLVGNAIKFTRKGHIYLAVNCVSTQDEVASLEIIVKDTGIGIPADRLNMIFERFEKVEPSYQGRYKGIGLGLAIVKKFIEGMGGEIKVDSALDQGSTFICTLPFTMQSRPCPSSIWHRHFSNLRLLIVDDIPLRANTYGRLLHTSQYQVLTSLVAETYLSESKFPTSDIVIIDDQLMHCDAQYLFDKIKQSNPPNQQPLITLFRSPKLHEETTFFQSQNQFDQFMKPITPHAFEQQMHQAWLAHCYEQNDILALVRQYQAHILLVEDEPFGQKIVSMLLEEELGCRVYIAKDGQEAIHLNSSNNYDLILMDIGLPGQDGLAVTEKIRRGEDNNETTPIVALTAHASDDIILRCKEVGMQDHLAKPTSTQALMVVIVKHVLKLVSKTNEQNII